MCEVVTDLVANAVYHSAREMKAAGIVVLDEDIVLMADADADGLVHFFHEIIDGEKVPSPPFSPWDSCLCGVDTAAALDRTPGLEWRLDEFMGEPEITAWVKP